MYHVSYIFLYDRDLRHERVNKIFCCHTLQSFYLEFNIKTTNTKTAENIDLPAIKDITYSKDETAENIGIPAM